MAERDYRYDAFRGFCMFLIVVQHFSLKSGFDFTNELGDYIYLFIEIFVMQGFFFLSGLFSKHPERGREKLFQALLWPVCVVGIFYWIGFTYYYGTEKALDEFQNGMVPYAMWFLVVLFVYRYFQVYYIDKKHIVLFALILYLVSGIFDPLSRRGFAVSRMCTFFITYIIGCKMSLDDVKKYLKLKWWQILLLGAFLSAATYALITYLPGNVTYLFSLSYSYRKTEISIWQGIIFRAIILVMSSLWIIFFLNIFGNKKGFFAGIGMHTMPVYIFHMIFAAAFMVKGITFGLYNFNNSLLVYALILFGFALVVSYVLSKKPFQKAYEGLMDGTYNLVFRRRSNG